MHRGAEHGRVLTGGGTAWSSTMRAEFVPMCPHQGPHRLNFGCFGSVRKQRFLVSCPRVSWPTPNPVGSVPDGASLRDQCGETPPKRFGKGKGGRRSSFSSSAALSLARAHRCSRILHDPTRKKHPETPTAPSPPSLLSCGVSPCGSRAFLQGEEEEEEGEREGGGAGMGSVPAEDPCGKHGGAT